SAWRETHSVGEACPRQHGGIQWHWTRGRADQNGLRDRLEVGTEMHRALVDEDGLVARFYSDEAIHGLIGHLRLVGRDDDLDAASGKAGRRAKVQVRAAVIGAGGMELAGG